MNLTDVFPTTESFFNATHTDCSEKIKTERMKRLEPIFKAVKQCIEEHGPMIADPQIEYALMCTTICIIDQGMEMITKEKNVTIN